MATPSTLTSCGPPAWDFSSFRKRGAKMPEIRMNVSSKEERADNGWGRSSKKGRNKGKRPLCILKRERESGDEKKKKKKESVSLSPPTASIYASVHHRLPISTDESGGPSFLYPPPLATPSTCTISSAAHTHTHTHTYPYKINDAPFPRVLNSVCVHRFTDRTKNP